MGLYIESIMNVGLIVRKPAYLASKPTFMVLSITRAFHTKTEVYALSQLTVEDEFSVFYSVHTQISFLQEK